jgi:GAF domain-containing protein
MDRSPLTSSIAELSKFFVGERTLKQTLDRVAELTQEAIPAAEMVGITMVVGGRQRTAVYTDPAVPDIDQPQFDTEGGGPCVDSFHRQQIFTIPSTTEDGPWPEFRRAASAHGVRSTLSMPLGVESRPLGALNLYAKTERAFGADATETAALFGSQVSVVLANAQAYWDARDLSRTLADAAATRSTIDIAKGIIMAGRRCDPDMAFNILVRASQRENRKLRDVAARIVESAAKVSASTDQA